MFAIKAKSSLETNFGKLPLFVPFLASHTLDLQILSGLYAKQPYILTYRKVASRSTSRLVARPRIFRLFMKGKFDAYVL